MLTVLFFCDTIVKSINKNNRLYDGGLVVVRKHSFFKSIFILLGMFVPLFPLFAERLGDWEFHLSKDKTYIIMDKYYGAGGEVVIPGSNKEGLPVKEMDRRLFIDCKDNITKITVPGSISVVPQSAFGNYKNLQTVILNNGITTIEPYAFARSEKLTEITIPQSVTSIGINAFEHCLKLKKVAVLANISTLKEQTFYECKELESVTLPTSLKSIEKNAFGYCSVLKSIIIPPSVTYIGEYAFSDTGITEIEIPVGVKEIGISAFQGCKSLKEITIAGSVSVIPERVVLHTSALETVTLGSGIDVIDMYAFHFGNFKTIIIPPTVTAINYEAFAHSNLVSITIPPSVKHISPSAFDGCSDKLVLSVSKDSFAEEYAKDFKFKYVYTE